MECEPGFRDPQSGGIGGHEQDAMFEVGDVWLGNAIYL
jgi:hypothetical protein